ncbi:MULTISPECIES: hypothetical protein [unclassified Mycobacterium]|uniref:hypothetical protein n=1 Tax=unclassified Mycobacterium TaxID=2642494 RepID=UPI0029C6E2C5|nr:MULTISPECIES: hypothetical protein [unclassified Mycobacterium]
MRTVTVLERALAALDPPSAGPFPTTRRGRVRAALGRRHGPIVRYWTDDWRLVHTEPARPERLLRWLARAPRRLIYAARAR